MNSLVSIIIPVYNVENYLEECISSVINQTYKNLEIILVDDGSTDSSGQICDLYAQRDTRIKVIHKHNGGQSDARNKALDVCTGEYISFVDSDDIVSKYFIEYFIKTIEKEQSDIVSLKVTATFWDDIDDGPSFNENMNYGIESFDSKGALELLLYQNVPTGMPHRLYKASLFQKIRFPKGKIYEDLATAYRLFMRSSKVSFIDSKLYGYRLRKDSTIRKKFNIDKMACVDISRDIYERVKEKYPELVGAAASRAFSANTSVFLQVPYGDNRSIDILWKEMKKYRYYILRDKSKYLRKKNKMCARVMVFGKRATYIIGKKFGQKGSMHP